MPDLELQGCSTEPLLWYLKALGILRLVAEDDENGDPSARGYWRKGVFVLRSRFDAAGLTDFFFRHYRPTPIVVPWSGEDFFGIRREGDSGPHKATPKSKLIIEAFLACDSARLQSYRQTVLFALDAMAELRFDTKSDGGVDGKKQKTRLLAALRSTCGEELTSWIDAAAQIESDRTQFNALLGSGGGNDGNAHFSDNFMQNLWEALPEFDQQRRTGASDEFVENALFGRIVKRLPKRTASLFHPGAGGGPNSTQGFDDGFYLNPWNFILGLEGTLSFAGAVTRRLGVAAGVSAFPFSVSLSAAGYGTSSRTEEGQREIWFPVWERALSFPELRTVFSEGRSHVGQRNSRSGSDFARAVAGYGVDAGIGAFERYAFVKGRVGDCTMAVPIGRFEVRERQHTSLLLEIDGWLDSYRRACRKDAPVRFVEALQRMDRAIIEYCRYGSSRMQGILTALGNIERQLAGGEQFRSNEKRTISPVGRLKVEWLKACDDGSVEYRLAAGLAGIVATDKLGNIRTNLEPIVFDGARAAWAAKRNSVVWTKGSLADNLIAVLTRRLMDSNKGGLKQPALLSRRSVRLDDVAAFLWRATDDRRIEELLWGLMLVDREEVWPKSSEEKIEGVPPLPRSYALLKMGFLGREFEDVSIWADPSIVTLLSGGDAATATVMGARRLQSSGFFPITIKGTAMDPSITGPRLAAALLFPVTAVTQIAAMVMKTKTKEEKGEQEEAYAD